MLVSASPSEPMQSRHSTSDKYVAFIRMQHRQINWVSIIINTTCICIGRWSNADGGRSAADMNRDIYEYLIIMMDFHRLPFFMRRKISQNLENPSMHLRPDRRRNKRKKKKKPIVSQIDCLTRLFWIFQKGFLFRFSLSSCDLWLVTLAGMVAIYIFIIHKIGNSGMRWVPWMHCKDRKTWKWQIRRHQQFRCHFDLRFARKTIRRHFDTALNRVLFHFILLILD